jgi:large subunit ribosomal protein L18
MEETLMAKGSNYRVKLRRRREGKTDYQARKALVASGKPRLVTRTANRNITVQILIAKPHGDEVLAAANSRELVKSYGWKAATGNIPAAYLTGLLCGSKAKANGIKEAILDIGLVAPTKGAKIFAALSGVLDAGVDVPHSEEKIVKERMKGEHIAKYAKSLGAGSEEYTAKFSKYSAQGVAPEKISEHFATAKTTITDSFKTGKQVIPKIEKEAPAEKVPEKKAEKVEKALAAKKVAAKKPAAKKEAAK